MGLKFSLFATLWIWVLVPAVYTLPFMLGTGSLRECVFQIVINFLIFEVAYLLGYLSRNGSLKGRGFNPASFKIVAALFHDLKKMTKRKVT